MEEIYSEEQKIYKKTKARPATVQFLLGFSKSMHIIDYKKTQFEVNLN